MLTLLFLILLVTILAVGTMLQQETTGPVRADAANFMISLTEGRLEDAMALSAGGVLANLTRHRDQAPPPGAEVIKLDFETKAAGHEWAMLDAEIEIKTGLGAVDVQWYRLGLIKTEDKKWRVYHMEKAMPRLDTGVSGLIARFVTIEPKGIKATQQVFRQYLERLTQNKYKDAGSLLAGSAAEAHRAAESVLSRSPLISQVSDISFKTKWATDSFVTLQANYRADGRDVSAIVMFYKTSAGWRILSAKQI